jgi:stage IV sporulation protein FB
MFLTEPAPTQGDLHFRLFGFPVRVHPFFWLVTLILGLGGGDRQVRPLELVIWIAVVFVSILVHELGHAFVQRFFGGHPWITLYGFGGLASCADCDRRPWSQILISLAGPIAGFLLAGIVVAILFASGRLTGFTLDWMPVMWREFPSFTAEEVVWRLLVVNIIWGLVNLLPIYPLDGGQVARQLFLLGRSRNATLYSLYLSAAVAVVVAGYALMNQEFYVAIMFGLLAYGNVQAIQFNRNQWR